MRPCSALPVACLSLKETGRNRGRVATVPRSLGVNNALTCYDALRATSGGVHVFGVS
jgi:hypothetical protein